MPVTTVFFDFGGTIAEQLVNPIDVWSSLSDRLKLGASQVSLGQALTKANEWFRTAVYDYRERMDEFWRLYDEQVLGSLGISSSRDLVSTIQEEFRTVKWHRAYPESHEVLEELRVRGYRLGVISNAAEELVERMRELELAGYFTTITYSQEARSDKPNPAIFRLALGRANCNPGDAVHVGNTYEEDVVGARNAGIRPVLVDREGRQPDADCSRVGDLRAVVDLLSNPNLL